MNDVSIFIILKEFYNLLKINKEEADWPIVWKLVCSTILLSYQLIK